MPSNGAASGPRCTDVQSDDSSLWARFPALVRDCGYILAVKPIGALINDPAEIEGTMSLCLVRAQTVASSSCQEPLPMFTASRSSRLPRVIVYPLSTAIATLPLPAA